MRTTLLSLTAAAIVTGSALLAPPAGAIDHRGVKTLTYHEADETCTSGQALPCTTNAGHGSANVLRIVQTEQPEGGLAFEGFTTTSLSPSHLWMAATIAAECRTGYALSHASIEPGYRYGQERLGPEEVHDGWQGMTVSVPDAKVMPTKKLAINIPVAEAFDGWTGFVDDFETLGDVYAYGEQRIDQRIANGMNEAHARSIPFQVTTYVITHAEVRCSGANRTFVKWMPRYLPLTIQFVPVAEPTIQGQGLDHPGDGLTFEPRDTGRNS
jgi:hypothetical protein